MVRQMLMNISLLHPRSRKTPSGGRMIAKKILMMSLLTDWLAQDTKVGPPVVCAGLLNKDCDQ